VHRRFLGRAPLHFTSLHFTRLPKRVSRRARAPNPNPSESASTAKHIHTAVSAYAQNMTRFEESALRESAADAQQNGSTLPYWHPSSNFSSLIDPDCAVGQQPVPFDGTASGFDLNNDAPFGDLSVLAHDLSPDLHHPDAMPSMAAFTQGPYLSVLGPGRPSDRACHSHVRSKDATTVRVGGPHDAETGLGRSPCARQRSVLLSLVRQQRRLPTPLSRPQIAQRPHPFAPYPWSHQVCLSMEWM
jgi:hypothetical protein